MVLRESGSTPTRYQYSGQYSFASEFGLLDFKARYYDPALGRFAAADTIIPQGQGAQAWDRYAYANNSPVVYNDPSGHAVDPCRYYHDGYCAQDPTGKRRTPGSEDDAKVELSKRGREMWKLYLYFLGTAGWWQKYLLSGALDPLTLFLAIILSRESQPLWNDPSNLAGE